jgi:hypothetical protein
MGSQKFLPQGKKLVMPVAFGKVAVNPREIRGYEQGSAAED